MTKDSPVKAGLLIVDCQALMGVPREICTSIEALQFNYNTVVITRFETKESSLFRKQLNWPTKGDGEKSPLSFKPKPGSLVIDKTGYGIPAEDLVFFEGFDEWHLCGAETDACVLAIAFQLWDLGIKPRLLPKHTYSSDQQLHSDALRLFKRQFGASAVIS